MKIYTDFQLTNNFISMEYSVMSNLCIYYTNFDQSNQQLYLPTKLYVSYVARIFKIEFSNCEEHGICSYSPRQYS